MSEEKYLLEFVGVTGTSRKNYKLQDITFSLPAGFIAGIAGENGAGKTTLFDYIMHPKKQYAGSILLNGKEIHDDYVSLRQQIGFVSEKNRFFMEKSARENAKLAACLFDGWDSDLFEKTMKEMGVSLSRPLSKLSRGEYMKYQTAYAMAHHPVLYLLDEVTAGMDPVFRIDYFKLLQSLLEEENTSVLMISHIQEEMDRKMDFVGVMEEGRLVSWEENL
ncbi:MAG: ABC transporter ATP-binding protein [Lachnospiraceae bacterium]|nr:ABC transporter ATP-binding protein [Lachnospiraceae bacterium]